MTARLTRATLPDGVTWADVFGMAVIAGIGFTVAMLIADLSFTGMPRITEQAKTAVLVASLGAALMGGLLLGIQGHRHRHGRAGGATS